jgi:hypothetical protein
MLVMTVFMWDPADRDDVLKRRMEKGAMAPAGMKILGEWVDVSGGRVFRLSEVKDAKTMMAGTLSWSDLGFVDSSPVLETDEVMKLASGK